MQLLVNMFHIKSILPQIIRNLKVGRLDKNVICKEAERIIKKGTPNIKVLFYKDKTLGIKCFDSITANEIFLNQERIKNKINQSLKKEAVKKLIIKSR